jgi:endo-1,4-beta-xylanase
MSLCKNLTMKRNIIRLIQHGHYLLFVLAIGILYSSQLFAAAIQTDVPALKDVYANDFYMGCILSYKHIGFPDDTAVPGQSAVIAPDGGNLVKFHLNSMTPGNNMKPAYTVDLNASAAAYSAAVTQEERDSIEIHPIVRFNGDIIAQLNWARRQGFTFRGHTLVWHNSAPARLFRKGYSSDSARLSKEMMTLRMENYIKEVFRIIHESWPGVLSAMDVVNEAVTDGSGTDRTDSEWYLTFGDNSYIMQAFELAHKYRELYSETQIKLYYNDYNTDVPAKANGIVRICGPVFRAGYLDGIGMQGHDAFNSPTADEWIAMYNNFDTVCNEMAVTEYYVELGSTTANETNLAVQANQYAMLFKIYLDRSYFSGRGKIINLTKDGLNDQYTLFPYTLSSLWDANNQCKPAFYAIAQVGINYHTLDTLIAYAENLDPADYTTEQWENLTDKINSAKDAFTRNYSASESAVTGLGNAITYLLAAIDGRINGVDTTEALHEVFVYIAGQQMTINNIPAGSEVLVYGLNSALLHAVKNATEQIVLPYSVPCIVRVVTNNGSVTLKAFR